MKYSKTAIGLLTAQYRSVLKKCLLINLGLFALGAVTATPANALTASAILGSGALTDGVDLVTVDKYSAGNATGGDIGVYGNVAQTNSFTADNITISGTQYGTLLYNGVTFNIGGDNTQTVNISGEAVGLYTQNTSVVNVIASDSVTVSSATGDAITAWAKKENNSWVANSGGKININTGDLTVTAGGMGVSANYGKSQVAINATGDVNITATGGTDNRAIHVGNSTTNDNVSKEDTSFVTIKAENINLTSDKIGVSAMSNGIVELDGNTKIIAKDGDTLKDAILARGKAKVEVNKSGEHTTQMEGNINFNYDAPTSGSIVDAIVDVTLSGADSYWTGNTTASWTGTPPTEDYLNVTSSTINLKDGATWTASQITDTATGEGASASGTKYAVLNNLNVDNANVVVQDATRGVTIDNLVAKNANISGAGKLNVDKSADLRDGVKNDYAGKINVNDGAELYVDADANGDLDAVDGDKSQIKLANITLISALAAGDKIKTAGYQMTHGALKSLEAYYQTITNDGAGNLVLGAKQDYTDLIGILQNGNYIKAYDAADADNTSVAANLTALDNQVFANATAIDTNTANIATNTDNIATNTAAIADNAAAIAAKQDALTQGSGIAISDDTISASGIEKANLGTTLTNEIEGKLTGVAATSIVTTDNGFATAAQVAGAIASAGEGYVTDVAESAATADDGTIAVTKGGTTTNVAVKGWANKADVSTVSSLTNTVSGLSDTVDGHTTTLTTLQSGATTEGSIDYKIANATIQASKVSGLADIATTGSYEDLSVEDGAIAQAKVNGLTNALAGKVDVVEGKQLSTEDFTTAEKNKLADIAAGAQVNTIEGIKVNGTTVAPGEGKIVDITAVTGIKIGSADAVAGEVTLGTAAGRNIAGEFTPDDGYTGADITTWVAANPTAVADVQTTAAVLTKKLVIAQHDLLSGTAETAGSIANAISTADNPIREQVALVADGQIAAATFDGNIEDDTADTTLVTAAQVAAYGSTKQDVIDEDNMLDSAYIDTTNYEDSALETAVAGTADAQIEAATFDGDIEDETADTTLVTAAQVAAYGSTKQDVIDEDNMLDSAYIDTTNYEDSNLETAVAGTADAQIAASIADTDTEGALGTLLAEKYNWSNITGAEAAGNELAETVTADTHVYSVAAAEQKFLNKTSETADGASMTLDNTNADFAVIGTDGNADNGYYNILRVSSDGEGIILNARPTGTTGQGSTLEVTKKGVYYNNSEVATADDLALKADLTNTDQTITSKAYVAGDWKMTQAGTGSLIIGKAGAVNAVIFDKDLTAQHYKFGTNTFESKASIATEGNFRANGQLTLGYGTNDQAVLTGAKIKQYDGYNNLFEDNPEATTEGQKLTVAASVEKGIRASVVEGEENGIVADYVISKLTSGDQDIVAASVTANSLTLGGSAPVTGTSGRDAAAIALDDNDMPYVADGSDATLATTASLNQAVNNVLTFAGQTFNAKQQWLDTFTGLDSNKSNAEAFEEEFSGDTNLWVGDGHGEHPTNLAGVFHNINSALGTIHGLVNADGSVNNDTSVFKNGPITSELTGEEISTALRSGTSVEELEVDLDNAVAKIRSGETLVGKAFADKDGNEIDTTYAKLYNDASFNNLYANTLGINGAAQIDGTLRVKGLAQFDDNLSVAKDFSVGGAFTFDENTFSSVATAIDENATDGMLPTAGAVKNIIDSTIDDIEDGTIVAGKAVADQNGNVIDETYATKDEAMLKVDYLYEDTADIDGATIHDGTITGAKLTNNSVTWDKLGGGVQAWIRKIGDADFSDAVHEAVVDATGNVTEAVLALDGLVGGVEDIIGDGDFSDAVNTQVVNANDLTDAVVKIGQLIGDFKNVDAGYTFANIKSLANTDGSTPTSLGLAIHNLGLYVDDGVVTVENTGVQEINGNKQFNGSATFAKLNFVGGAEVTSISTDEISDTPSKTALVTEYAVADAISTAGEGYVKTTDIVTNYDPEADVSDTTIYSTSAMKTALGTKQDVIDDLDDIREGAALGATSVQGVSGETYLSIATVDDVKTIAAGKIAESHLTEELKAKIALTEKIGDLSALHAITNNANDSKAENLVVAINNFDDNLHNKVNTYTATQAFTGGIKFSTAGDAQVVSAVDDGQGAVAVGEGRADTLATTATVLKSAQNAEFSAGPNETLPDSLNGAGTIHSAIVNVATEVDDLNDKVGDLNFSGANNVEATDLTEAVLDLDKALGDVKRFGSDEYTGTNAAGAADVVAAVEAIDVAVGDLSGMTATYIDGATDLATAIQNVATNAENAAGEAKEYTDSQVHGTGDGSEVTVGDNADKTTIGKTNPDTGLTGIEVDTVNKEITVAVNGNGTSSEIAMDEEGISMTSTVNGKSVGIDIANDDEGRSITMGDAGYGLKIDVDEGTTTIGTGAEGENVQIGKGTMVADKSIAVGTVEEGEITEGVQLDANGDVTATGNGAFGGTLDVAGNVTVGEDAVVIGAEDGSITTAGDVTVGEDAVVIGAEDGSIETKGDVTVGGNETVAGTLGVDGATTLGSTLDVAGDVTVGEDAVVIGAEDGSIETKGDVTVGGNETVAGTLGVDGATTLGDTLDVDGKTTLSAENGMAFGEGPTVTGINDGSEAVEGDGDAATLATTATLMNSAENAKFTGATDENHATGEAETIKQAFQNIDTFVGSKEALTNKGISDKADLTTAFNSFADNVEAGMGGEFAEGGEWSAEISNEADAPEDGYYSAFTAENLADAISTVYSTIGTADKLQGYNGVSAENTVNDNIAAVNETVGDFGSLKNEFGNLSSYGEEGSQAVEPEDITAALDNIDATFGRIHGLFDGEKVNTTGGIESTTGSHSNLAKGTTVEMHLVSLDNAIGDRSSITNENGSNGYVLVERDSVADVLSDIASQIGTAEELAGATINGVSADNTVNANIAAINSSLGDISELKDAAFAQGATLVDAVKNVDDKLVNLDNRVAKTEKDLKELHHDFRRGMASMAAMSALVPNSRSTGKTSLSIGTGAYGGHGAVAVGGFHYITDNLMLNAGVSWSDSSDAAYRMGVTYSF